MIGPIDLWTWTDDAGGGPGPGPTDDASLIRKHRRKYFRHHTRIRVGMIVLFLLGAL